MSPPSFNLHATAIVIGTTGLLFIGPSGCGKSMLALATIAAARREGLFGALISDDQVLISIHDGHIVARQPASIAGLIEVRGSGIARVPGHPAALVHHAVMPVRIAATERLPEEGERFEVTEGVDLPLIRLPAEAPDPFAILSAFIPFSVNGGAESTSTMHF